MAIITRPNSVQLRSVSSTARNDKGPVDATKDTLKKADRVVSDAAVKGIDKGEHAKDKIKEAVGSTTHEAKTKTEHMRGEAAEYKGKAEAAAGEVKGKTSEAMSDVAGRAKEAKRSHLG